MLDREQVLHVARLARLELTEEEIERMAAQLSHVLEHIEKIGELELGGVPLAVKALFWPEGVPSQSGSRILEGYRPPYTATVVEQLADAGATLLGKTNQDEFAMGSSTENSAYGPTLNPWSRDKVPGG